jgi:hypothetical protein
MHDPLDRLGAQWRLAPRSRRISAQPDEAFRKEALHPPERSPGTPQGTEFTAS